MAGAIEMPAQAWKQLNIAWIIFYLFLGAINLYVAYTMSEEAWVNFKLFGMLGLTVVFILLQGFYISKHIEPETNESSNENDN